MTKFGRAWQTSALIRQKLTNVGRNWPTVGRVRRRSAEIWPEPAMFVPDRPNNDQSWPKSPKRWSTSVGFSALGATLRQLFDMVWTESRLAGSLGVLSGAHGEQLFRNSRVARVLCRHRPRCGEIHTSHGPGVRTPRRASTPNQRVATFGSMSPTLRGRRCCRPPPELAPDMHPMRVPSGTWHCDSDEGDDRGAGGSRGRAIAAPTSRRPPDVRRKCGCGVYAVCVCARSVHARACDRRCARSHHDCRRARCPHKAQMGSLPGMRPNMGVEGPRAICVLF